MVGWGGGVGGGGVTVEDLAGRVTTSGGSEYWTERREIYWK